MGYEESEVRLYRIIIINTTISCVRWYTGFINRSLPVRTCFSACGRYIATGSEENAVS